MHSAGCKSHRQMLLPDNLRKRSGLLYSDCSSGYVACIYLMSNLTSGLPFLPLFLQSQCFNTVWFSMQYLSRACHAILMHHLNSSFVSKLLPFTGAEQFSDSERLSVIVCLSTAGYNIDVLGW